MKLLDKLKNALFEEEYVEVDTPTRKEKAKEKTKEKPIAKKMILPKEEKTVQEEEPEEKKDFVFPIMDESDFVDLTEPAEEEPPVQEEEEFLEIEEDEPPVYQEELRPRREEKAPLYTGGRKQEPEIQIHEYGFEKKKEKALFTPSPIISPIYGILDKNYKKEDVVSKKEVRLSSYAGNRMDLDAVRAKAYGETDDQVFEEELTNEPEEPQTVEAEEKEEALLDISDDTTPSVPKVTVGDAEEYFEDLGLEYNIDYKDVSKERATGRRSDLRQEEKTDDGQVEDNLFDLIDSMYEEKDGE